MSADAELLPLEQTYPQYAVGTLDVTYSPMQKSWYWMDMDTREAVLFQTSGSHREPNLNSILHSARCAHSLFFSLGPEEKLMTRQSIEARCIVITSG